MPKKDRLVEYKLGWADVQKNRHQIASGNEIKYETKSEILIVF